MNSQLENYIRTYDARVLNNREWVFFDDPEKQGVARVWYGNIHDAEQGSYIEVPVCTYSDYSGTTVERSNCQSFLRIFAEHLGKDVWELCGGFNTTGVLIRTSLYENNPEVKEVIDGLFDYPLINEEDYSELELELEQVSWDTWLEYELKSLLEQKEIEYNEETLQQDFYYVADDIAEYFIHEDANCPYFRTEKVVDAWVESLAKRSKDENNN